MKHQFVDDKSIDLSDMDGILNVEVCKFCDVRRWTWLDVKPGKLTKYQYMFNKDTQYWNPEEECKNPYKLQELCKQEEQLTLSL